MADFRLILLDHTTYGHEIAARAATSELRAMGGQCIGVQETPISNPGGTPIFGPQTFQGNSWKKRGVEGVRVNNA